MIDAVPFSLRRRLRPLTGAAWPFRIFTWLSLAGLITGWVAMAAMSAGFLGRGIEPFWVAGHGVAVALGMVSFSPLGLLSTVLAVLTFFTVLFLSAGGASC